MLNILKKKVLLGETIFDHSIKKPIKINAKNLKEILFGIVDIDKSNNEFIYGFFTGDPINNILVSINEEITSFAINKKALRNKIIYDNNIGLYRLRGKMESGDDIILLKGVGRFPYSISREYESHDHLLEFSVDNNEESMYDDRYKNLLKYTFGLEYETTQGYIPQELCYRYGLIPLRDGSISGVEYASTVLDKDFGLERISKHFDLLKKYTNFNKECSYHIHMGGYPLDPKAIFSLYTVWSIICDELQEFLPELAFKTSLFKASRKDYCKRNPRNFNDFSELYSYLSGGYSRYAGSLTQNHPQDAERRAKWQIRERYWAQSLIGMCFYKGPKTVEYRMLAPTYNEHKIIFWIYLFNAIMIYSENMALQNARNKYILLPLYRETKSIDHIIKSVYPEDLVIKMNKMIEKLKYIVNSQKISGDLIGENIYFEDNVIDSGIL